MSIFRLRVLIAAFLAIVAVMSALVPGDDVRAQGTAKKNSQYQNYWNQLKSRFQSWDLNGDNVLDKAELAKAFRGPKAKPYDYVPDDSTKPKKVKAMALALVSLPRPSLPANFAVAEALTRFEPSKATNSGPNPAVLQYGDFQLLALIGKNDTVAKKDFDSWSSGYAKNLDRFQELQREVKAAQAKLAKAKTANQIQTATNELNKHQNDLTAVNAQLSAISSTIQAALNVKK
jgi:hypothetical protein